MMIRDMNVKNVEKHLFAMITLQNTKRYIQVRSGIDITYLNQKIQERSVCLYFTK